MTDQPDAEYETLRVEVRGSVLYASIHRPDRKNALSPRTIDELIGVFDRVRDDHALRVLVLSGTGGVFSAGADLGAMSAESAGISAQAPRGDFADLLLRFRALGKPVIARVPGLALAGALGLVASAHFAVAARSATFGTPEILRGLFPMQIIAVLSRLLTRRALLELVLLGERVDAERALALGLVSRVVADDDLDREVDALASTLASRSPTAMRLGLEALHVQEQRSFDDALPYLRERFFTLLGTEDAREGLAAFFEKREPRWTGR